MRRHIKTFIFCSVFFFISCSTDNRPDLFAIPYRPQLDITRQARRIPAGPTEVQVDVNRPIKPFQHQYFQLIFYADSQPVVVQHPKLTFNMKMDMGRLIYLPTLSGRKYIADVQVPKCLTGAIRWYGKLEFEYREKIYSRIFLFDVE